MRLCILYVVILGSASGIFRHIQVFSKSTLTHMQNLEYRWHI